MVPAILHESQAKSYNEKNHLAQSYVKKRDVWAAGKHEHY